MRMEFHEDPPDSVIAEIAAILATGYPLGLEAVLYGLGLYIRPVVRLDFGTAGMPSERQSITSRTSRMCSPTYWLSRPQKSMFFALNAPFGKRPRCFMQSSIPAGCRPASRGTTTTWLVCIGMSSGSLR
jgi:hypothetical protein